MARLKGGTGPGHPFEGVRFTAAWGSRGVLDVVLVRPDLVAEISADRAVDRGVFRHPLRFQRPRLDVTWTMSRASGWPGCGGRLTAARAAAPGWRASYAYGRTSERAYRPFP